MPREANPRFSELNLIQNEHISDYFKKKIFRQRNINQRVAAEFASLCLRYGATAAIGSIDDIGKFAEMVGVMDSYAAGKLV